MILEVEIEERHIQQANELYDFDALNNSITKGKSNTYGAIGEVVILEYLRKNKDPLSENKGNFHYDIICENEKWEVKTKRTRVKPKSYYLCSVPAYNTSQKCDYYVFVRVLEDYSKAYILGYISRDDFYKKSFFKKKGEKDINGFEFKADCFNIKIENLEDITDLV